MIIAALVGEKRYGTIDVYGYTDSSGSTQHNLQLSRHRADVVVEYLQDHPTSSQFEFVSHGQGETDFVTSNATPEGRQKNRRVEIKVPDPQPEDPGSGAAKPLDLRAAVLVLQPPSS